MSNTYLYEAQRSTTITCNCFPVLVTFPCKYLQVTQQQLHIGLGQKLVPNKNWMVND